MDDEHEQEDDDARRALDGGHQAMAQPAAEERRRRHLEAIPRHVANSMAMEGEPVDEAWIRERLTRSTEFDAMRRRVGTEKNERRR